MCDKIDHLANKQPRRQVWMAHACNIEQGSKNREFVPMKGCISALSGNLKENWLEPPEQGAGLALTKRQETLAG